jgi:hypothetical protein
VARGKRILKQLLLLIRLEVRWNIFRRKKRRLSSKVSRKRDTNNEEDEEEEGDYNSDIDGVQKKAKDVRGYE